MKTVLLTQGMSTIVEDEDYERVSKFKWMFNKKGKYGGGYAQRSQHVKVGFKQYKTVTIYMHRFILNAPNDNVDHINGNTLDNRRENLRVVPQEINVRNRRSVPGSTSKYVGVHLHKLTGKWRAQIKVDSEAKSLGLFSTQEEANEARVNFIKINNLSGFGR